MRRKQSLESACELLLFCFCHQHEKDMPRLTFQSQEDNEMKQSWISQPAPGQAGGCLDIQISEQNKCLFYAPDNFLKVFIMQQQLNDMPYCYHTYRPFLQNTKLEILKVIFICTHLGRLNSKFHNCVNQLWLFTLPYCHPLQLSLQRLAQLPKEAKYQNVPLVAKG